jgi:acyl-CoA-binding protein
VSYSTSFKPPTNLLLTVIDRVFVHALQTVRRLPRTGSSRPPPSSRLALYGLYKQSMEGDVASILPRPSLPPSSPDPASSSVHKYASRDLRAREAQAEVEKWDAWNACAGMSRTEAKRRYITTLIDTMKVYASGTAESRELVGELEFVWGQIRSQSGSEEEGDGESPTRNLERAGLRQTGSYSSIPPGRGLGPGGGEEGSRMRVLSPVSRGGSGEIIEGEDVDSPEPEGDGGAEDDEDDFRDARDGSEDHVLDRRRPPENHEYATRNLKWRRRVEEALTKMTAEIAALREQLSDSRVFGTTAHRRTGLWAWMKWLVWAALRQVAVNVILIGMVVLWGRWKGDRRAEEWVKRRWKELSTFLQTLTIWKRLWPAWIPRLA